jgi:hypothetical protein
MFDKMSREEYGGTHIADIMEIQALKDPMHTG